MNYFNSFKDPEITKIVQAYIKKNDHLNKILRSNEEIINVEKI